MASTPTTASVAATHGKYVKLVDMARVAGTDGERDNALRLLARLFPGGAPEAPYVEPTTLITIKELGLGYHVINRIQSNLAHFLLATQTKLQRFA